MVIILCIIIAFCNLILVVPGAAAVGEKIAFASNRTGNLEIYVMNTDGTQQTRITTDPAADYLPAWSPNGTKIAFTSYRDGNDEIYVMNPERYTTDLSDK